MRKLTAEIYNIQINALTFAAIAEKTIPNRFVTVTMIKEDVNCHRQVQSVDKYRESYLFHAFLNKDKDKEGLLNIAYFNRQH